MKTHIRFFFLTTLLATMIVAPAYKKDIHLNLFAEKPAISTEKSYCILEDKSLKINYISVDNKQLYCTAVNGLNVRQSSTTSSVAISSVKFADTVDVDGISADKKWWHLKGGGYVFAEYLSEEQPLKPKEHYETGYGELISLGMFRVTFYCNCEICGGHSSGLTSTGTYPQAGWTIAIDPDVIPLGSTVYINGSQYHAEDTGVYGNTIDVYMDSHQAALDRGVEYAEVFVEK